MRFLRDRSIAAKLAMSASCALLLVGALALCANHGIRTLTAAQKLATNAAAAERQIKDALISAEGLRVLGRQLATAQTTREVANILEAAKKAAAAAREKLDALSSATTDQGQGKSLESLAASFASVTAVLQQEADLRKNLLQTRQRQLLEARGMFQSSMDSFRDQLEQGGLSKGGVDAVAGSAKEQLPPELLDKAKAAFAAYGLALDRAQNAALLFLATGNRGAANETKDAATAAQTRMNELLSLGLPDSTKNDARVVSTLGQAISEAAASVVDQTIALDQFVDGKVETANHAISTAVMTLAEQLTKVVQASDTTAAQTQVAANRLIMFLSAGIILVLLVSSWLTSRAISRPIRALTAAVQAIAQGDTAVSISLAGGKSEIGRMAAALEVLRGTVQDAFIKAEMIRQFPIGMMMASAAGDLPLTVINPAAEQMLELVPESLPVPADQTLGRSLTSFYPDPEAHLAVLADPDRLPDRTRITIGPEIFELHASAIRDKSGAYAGPMVTWHRMTGQVRLVEQFERDVGQIAQTVGNRADAMRATALAMNEATEDAGHRTETVAAASEEAAANVASVASSAEELAASVSEIARQVSESAQIAQGAVAQASAADQCMLGLSDASSRIGDVVRLIGDIAGRTNLLALNATIEAARAGEAGKGFAVVASEVKTLATQTARATEDIATQITAMQGATTQAVESLRSISKTIRRMNEIAIAIAGATEEQGATTSEIARAVQQAAQGTSEVTENITRVAGSVASTGRQSSEALSAATELASQSQILRSEMDRFLTAIQQAA